MLFHRSLFIFEIIICFIAFLFCCRALASGATVDAAEYYFNRQDFKQALELYSKAEGQKNIIRIAELKFLLEGRRAAREVLVTFLEKNKILTDDLKGNVSEKLSAILEIFSTDEGLSEYYRAVTKIRHGDWSAAELLLEGALAKEDGNTLILELKSQCEKELKKTGEYTDTLALLNVQNPFSLSNKEKLAEAYFLVSDFTKVQTLLTSTKLPKNSYGNLLLLMSHFEMNKYFDLDEMEDLASAYPIALFYLGKELMKNEEDKEEAKNNLELFLSKYSSGIANVAWDPLKIADKMAEAKKLVAAYSSSIPQVLKGSP